jgi:MFS family permease
MSLGSSAMNATRIVAPAVGGLLIATPIGIGGGFAVLTVLYGVAALLTVGLPKMPVLDRDTKVTFFGDFAGGFSFIRRNELVLGLLLLSTVPVIFMMPYQTLLPVFAKDVWDVGGVGLGVMQAVSGVGGLAGGLVVANMDRYPRKGRIMFIAAMSTGVFLIAFALSPIFGVALPLLTMVGFSSMIFMTVNNTVLQSVIPDNVRGRVMSVMMMTFGLMPLGAVPASIAAAFIGTPAVVAIGGVLMMTTVVALFALYPAFRGLDGIIRREQAVRDAEHAAALEAAAALGTAAASTAPGQAAAAPSAARVTAAGR